MGKILVIKDTDFSEIAVLRVLIINNYIQEETSSLSELYTKVFVDNSNKILYAEKADGTIEDNSEFVIDKTVSDGTLVTEIINAYKNEL